MKHRSFFPARVTTLIALAFALLVGTVSAQVVEPLAQDAPIEISAYRTGHTITAQMMFIDHFVGLTNTSEQAIVAFSVGVLSFDAFWDLNAIITSASRQRIAPGASVTDIELDLQQVSPDLTTYPDFGSSFAFIHRVRFEDGTVWRYDAGRLIDALNEQAPEGRFEPETLP